jgi:hypothetical protein
MTSVNQRTLTTYAGTKAACNKACRYLAARSILSKFEQLRRGHYSFIMHIPAACPEANARSVLSRAFEGVDYEPPVYKEETVPAAGSLSPRSKSPLHAPPLLGTHLASLNLFREADGSLWITISGHSMALMVEHAKYGGDESPAHYIDKLVIEAAQDMISRARPAPDMQP